MMFVNFRDETQKDAVFTILENPSLERLDTRQSLTKTFDWNFVEQVLYIWQLTERTNFPFYITAVSNMARFMVIFNFFKYFLCGEVTDMLVLQADSVVLSGFHHLCGCDFSLLQNYLLNCPTSFSWHNLIKSKWGFWLSPLTNVQVFFWKRVPWGTKGAGLLLSMPCTQEMEELLTDENLGQMDEWWWHSSW